MQREKAVCVVILALILSVGLYGPALTEAAYAIKAAVCEGDLVIEEGETKIIENLTLELNGSIVAKPGSALIIRNSTVIVHTRYKAEHIIRIERAYVEVTNSEVKEAGLWMEEKGGELLGPEMEFLVVDSVVKIENSRLYCRLHVGGGRNEAYLYSSLASYLYWECESRIDVVNTSIAAFVFCFRNNKPETIFLSGLRKNQPVDFTLETNDGGRLLLRRTAVKARWHIDLEGGNTKNITIDHSDIAQIWLKFPPTDTRITIKDLPKGFIEQFTLSKSIQGIELPFDITIIDSNLEDTFKPEMMNTIAEFENVFATIHPYDKSDLIVRNSTLYSFINYGCKLVRFENCGIYGGPLQLIHKPEFKDGEKFQFQGRVYEIYQGGTFHLIFERTTVDVPLIVVACNKGIIEGNVTIRSPSIYKVNWINGTVLRKYPLLARNVNGEPVANATIRLYDKNENCIKTLETDKDGRVELEMRFTKQNSSDEWRLEALVENTRIS